MGYSSQNYPDQMMGLSGSFPGTVGSIRLISLQLIHFVYHVTQAWVTPPAMLLLDPYPHLSLSYKWREGQGKRWARVTSRDTSSLSKRKTLFSPVLNPPLSLKLQRAEDRALPP